MTSHLISIKNKHKWIATVLVIISGWTTSSASAHGNAANLRLSLGKQVEILDAHSMVQTAPLKIISVAESKKHALKDKEGRKRIAGYPKTGKLKKINKDNANQLARLLQADNVFVHSDKRCANKEFQGIRFSKGKQRIEVVLGIPCNQVAVAFVQDNTVKWWAGVMTEPAMKRVLQLVGKQPVKKAAKPAAKEKLENKTK